MLYVVGHADGRRVDAEFSEYIPFAFRFEHVEGRPHIYWRTGDMQSTFLEIEISPINGGVVGGLLLLAGDVIKGLPDFTLPFESSVGVPIVAMGSWSAGAAVDEPAPFCVFLEGSRLLIRFSLDEAVQSIEISGLVIGVAADSSMVWIFATDLSSEDLAKLTH